MTWHRPRLSRGSCDMCMVDRLRNMWTFAARASLYAMAATSSVTLQTAICVIRSIERGDGAGVEAAIEAGASVDRVERGGWAALHHAVASGNSEIVHLLMAYSASPDIRSMGQGEEGKTAVHWSALQGRLESLKILQENNCNLRAQVSGRGTALHYAAAFGDVEVVEWLVEQGVDITGKDKNGRLAKDVAKRNGHMHVHHLLKELAKRQPRNNKITKQDTTDHISVPVPKPRRRTLRGKKEEPRQESTVVQATRFEQGS
ncbi:Ankyrin repeat and SOCS box protein 3 [Portunus trituberculatus]|uniref:Ankyrin repeat and SOCS box protein 3 n=1 Tax=Portunus trituberculatus TaxID=210409 RepID=A0A5B7FHX4_PORTR|nr:Ankyrin repeat and SOCS box protein 3 [Portunus trituberculatus]